MLTYVECRLCRPIAFSPQVTSLQPNPNPRLKLGRRNMRRQGDGATQPDTHTLALRCSHLFNQQIHIRLKQPKSLSYENSKRSDPYLS